MRLIPVEDPTDPRLADYTSLTDVELRRVREPGEGLYLAESAKVIARALRAGHRPRSVLTAPKWLPELEPLLAANEDTPVYLADPTVLESLTGFRMHRGSLASMHRPILPTTAELLSNARRVVILEDIVDHTNVGAVFRSVAGLGADAVLVTERCADPLYRRSVRVSMGTVLQVPWTRVPDWSETRAILTAAGFVVAALSLSDGAIGLDDLAADPPARLALLLGSEGDGLTREAHSAADMVVTIPMTHGVDSLNVAAASAVALWATRPRD